MGQFVARSRLLDRAIRGDVERCFKVGRVAGFAVAQGIIVVVGIAKFFIVLIIIRRVMINRDNRKTVVSERFMDG
jgi:hypothetical protein